MNPSTLRKKVEPKRFHPGAVLENGATSEGGGVFSLNNHVWHQHSARGGAELRTMKRLFLSAVCDDSYFYKPGFQYVNQPVELVMGLVNFFRNYICRK